MKIEERRSLTSSRLPVLVRHGEPLVLSQALLQWLDDAPSHAFADVCLHVLMSYTSQQTRRAYWSDFAAFQKFCSKNDLPCETVKDIEPAHLTKWQSALFEEGASTTHINRKLSAMGALFRTAQRLGLVEKNPLDRIVKIRPSVEKPTRALDEDGTKVLLSSLRRAEVQISKDQSRAYKAVRLHRVLIEVLLSTGMRVSEVCELKCEHYREQAFFFVAKGQLQRKLVLHPETDALVRDYKEEFRAQASSTDPLFVRVQSVHGPERPLTQAGVDVIVRSEARKAGLKQGISAHSLRATCATLLHRQGLGLVAIQQRLGHAEVNTTGRYIKRNEDRSKAPTLQLTLKGFSRKQKN